MRYKRPTIETTESEFFLLCGSGPGADGIGSPSVRNNSKSVWDDEETQYNHKEERYED